MHSTRTRLSLAQFLEIQDRDFVALLLHKHGMDGDGLLHEATLIRALVPELLRASEGHVASLVAEIARTLGDLRNRVSPRYRFDERLADLNACCTLDGYVLQDGVVTPLDPSIMEGPAVEDDLTAELRGCGLPDATAVIEKIEDSARAFRLSPPNLNSCLNDARVAIQTLAAAIAQARVVSNPGTFDPTKWGSVIAYLRSTGFITEEEERGLVGVFGFVSPGSHRPIGVSDAELARLGRAFVAGMCWFLVKRYRGTP